MADIPVYLVAGFLDAGKTNFINGILEDGFARQDPTLLHLLRGGRGGVREERPGQRDGGHGGG